MGPATVQGGVQAVRAGFVVRTCPGRLACRGQAAPRSDRSDEERWDMQRILTMDAPEAIAQAFMDNKPEESPLDRAS